MTTTNKIDNMLKNARTIRYYVEESLAPVKYSATAPWVQSTVNILVDGRHNDTTYTLLKRASDAYIRAGGSVEEAIKNIKTDDLFDDLLEWMQNDVQCVEYIDKARKEFGKSESIVEDIKKGQWMRIKKMIEDLHALLEDMDNDDEEI